MKTRSVQSLKAKLAPREEVVQSHIIAALRAAGLRVLQTTHRYRRQRCPRCGCMFAQQGGYGADKGVPDLLARDPQRDGRGCWVGLEVKGAQTALSPEQKVLQGEGAIIVVRGVDEALRAMEVEK
jgi:hypothetical protein